MIYLRSKPYRNFCVSLLLLQLSGCSTIHDFFWPEDSETQSSAASPTRSKRKAKAISSSYEWAVQNYEAGAYDEAIRQFLALRKAGAEVPGYELIPFYLGMSYVRRGPQPKAQEELELFLRSQPKNREGAEARMALLLIYEQRKNWDQVVALAAETDQMQVFQDSRALLKLVWARALREKGELMGARAAIKDADQYMENTAEEGPEGKDLWGRYHYVQVLTQLQECAGYSAKSAGKKKLFNTWLESEGDCWKTAYEAGLKTFRLDNAWSNPSKDSLLAGLEAWSSKVKKYSQELKSLEPKRNLQKLARQQLYRTLAIVDHDLKDFKERALNSESLEQIRKHLDLLIVSI